MISYVQNKQVGMKFLVGINFYAPFCTIDTEMYRKYAFRHEVLFMYHLYKLPRVYYRLIRPRRSDNENEKVFSMKCTNRYFSVARK